MDLFIDADGVIREGRLVQVGDRYPALGTGRSNGHWPKYGSSQSGKSRSNALIRMFSKPFSPRPTRTLSRVADLPEGGGSEPTTKKSNWKKIFSLSFMGLKSVPEHKELNVPSSVANPQKQSQSQKSRWRSALYGKSAESSMSDTSGEVHTSGEQRFLFDSNGVPLFNPSKTKKKRTSSKHRRWGDVTPPVHSTEVCRTRSSFDVSSLVGESLPFISRSGSGNETDFSGHSLKDAAPTEAKKKRASGKKSRGHRKSFSDGYISFDEKDRAMEAENARLRALVFSSTSKVALQEAFFMEYQQKAAAAAAADDFSLPSPPESAPEEFRSMMLNQPAASSPSMAPRCWANASFRRGGSGVLQPRLSQSSSSGGSGVLQPRYSQDFAVGNSGSLQPTGSSGGKETSDSARGASRGKRSGGSGALQSRIEMPSHVPKSEILISSKSAFRERRRAGAFASKLKIDLPDEMIANEVVYSPKSVGKRSDRATGGGRQRRNQREPVSDSDLSSSEDDDGDSHAGVSGLHSKRGAANGNKHQRGKSSLQQGRRSARSVQEQVGGGMVDESGPTAGGGRLASRGAGHGDDDAASTASCPVLQSGPYNGRKAKALPWSSTSPVSPRSPIYLQYSSQGESGGSSGVVLEDANTCLLNHSPEDERVGVRREAADIPSGLGASEVRGRTRKALGRSQSDAGMLHGKHRAASAAGDGASTGKRRHGMGRAGLEGAGGGAEADPALEVVGAWKREQPVSRDERRKKLLQELKQWEWKEQGKDAGAEYEIQAKATL